MSKNKERSDDEENKSSYDSLKSECTRSLTSEIRDTSKIEQTNERKGRCIIRLGKMEIPLQHITLSLPNNATKTPAPNDTEEIAVPNDAVETFISFIVKLDKTYSDILSKFYHNDA